MKCFLSDYNLVKNWLFQNPFTSQEITPLFIYHSNISFRSLVRGDIFLLKSHPSLAQGHIMNHFGPFCTRIYIISTAFFRVQKGSKKDKNMMSYTRLYVDPTETLMYQARKMRLLSLLKEWCENMRGQNSSNIISNKKDTKLALIRPFVWTLGTLLSHFIKGFSSLKSPHPVVPPSPPDTPPPLSGWSQGHFPSLFKSFS